VLDFADMFFWGKYKAAKGTAQAAAYMVTASVGILVRLLQKTLVMVRLFFDWIEARL
jgi:hypothetical protein